MRKNLALTITLTITAATGQILGSCCGGKRVVTPTPPKTEKTTTTAIKDSHRERIDTVYITIPAQTAERTTRDSVSHLETDYAESEARIKPDGTLSHELRNKGTRHRVEVKHTTDSIYIDREKRVYEEVEVLKERKREWWETSLEAIGGAVAVGLLLISTVWIIKRKMG